MTNSAALTIFYDGLCPLCAREIEHYRKKKGSEKLKFMDITDPSFKAQEFGLDPKLVHQVMHVRKKDGTIATKVDAFIAIWQELPAYKLLARVADLRAVRPFLEIGYSGFARVRPYLPRLKTRPNQAHESCEQSPYCEKKESQG